MYSHGLATIALCEAYALTKDQSLFSPAMKAAEFIIKAQNQGTGGWRYKPQEDGDTSVVGWQIMALKSAQMAGLIPYSGSSPGTDALQGGSKWLDSVCSGPSNSEFSYRPKEHESNTMTSVGLLCRQYLGMKKEDPTMLAGANYLNGKLPDPSQRNVYYWYYASQVMHNMADSNWDTWNRKMRKMLIEMQNHNPAECANGSWDPDKPFKDQWGSRGGRVMMTSLACLTLEIYYRYLPLYKMDKETAGVQASGPPEKPVDKDKPKAGPDAAVELPDEPDDGN
jgi:hypothetical protein